MGSADAAIASALREVPGLRSGVREWLKKKPPAVRADRSVVLAAVQRDGLALEHAAAALRGDREVVLAAVRKGAFALQFAASELLLDRAFILAAVQRNGYSLACAPSKFRADHEVVLTAVREEAAALEYASERLRANSEVALVAARWSQPALEHVAPSLWANRAFALAVTERNAAAVEYFAAELRTDEAFLLSLVERNAEVLSFVPPRLLTDKDFLVAALGRNAAAMEHVPESALSDQALLLAAAERNSAVWEQLPEELWLDEAFVLAALKQDVSSFQYASPQLRASWDFVLKAVEHSAAALERAASRLRSDRDFVLVAVCKNAAVLAHAAAELRLDQSFALAAVRQNDLAAGHLPACLWGDPNFVLAMIDLDPSFLALATPDLRADRTFVLRAVYQQGLALEHAAASVQADREVVEAALASDVRALKHAAFALRADRSLVLPLVERSGGALQHAAEALKADREVVLAAVRSDGDALAHAVLELREDREFVLQAVQEDGSAFAHATSALRSDRSFVLQAVGKQGHALQFAAERLQMDEEFLLAAVKRNAWALSYVPAQQRASHAFVLAAVRTNGAALRFAPHKLQEDPAFMRAAKNGYVNGAMKEDVAGEGSDGESSLEDPFDFCELAELQLTGAESELAQEWEPEQTDGGDKDSPEPDDPGGGFFDFGELDELQKCSDAFSGEWEDEDGTVVVIKGMAMHGPDGTLDLKMVSCDTCTCEMGLEECEATLRGDGKLAWSDGCVWTRCSQGRHEFPQLETLSPQQLQAEYRRLGLPLEPELTPSTRLARLKLAALCSEAPLMEVVRSCRSRQVPTAGVSHLHTETAQRHALRRRLLTRECADAWQALGIPVSRFASIRDAAKAAKRCARLEGMSVAALEAEHRALGLPLDRVMQRRELEEPLKAVRVWQGMPLRELQRECRGRGLVVHDPSPGELEEQQRDRLLVRLIGTLSASALGCKGIPLQRLASVEVGVRVSEQWDRLEKLSVKSLEEECAALDLPPEACLQWYGRGDLVARLKLMALWREFSLEELSGECRKRGVAVEKFPPGPELHRDMCRALLLDLFADLYEERNVPVRQLGLLSAATAVFARWQQLADLSAPELSEEFRKLFGARPHDAIAPAEVRSRLQQAAVWGALPLTALRECCRQHGAAVSAEGSDEQQQRPELLEALLRTACCDVYSCRGVDLRELGSLAAASALLERWQRLDGLSEAELAEEYRRRGLPSPARNLRARLRSLARWGAMPYAALQQECWTMGLRSLYFQSFKELKGDKQRLLQELATAAWASGREQPQAHGPPPPAEPEEEPPGAKPEAKPAPNPGFRMPRQSGTRAEVARARPRPGHVVEHLRTLGLPADAGLEDVKKAYRKLALRHHPDKNPDGIRESATQLFQEVAEAYEALLGYLKDGS